MLPPAQKGTGSAESISCGAVPSAKKNPPFPAGEEISLLSPLAGRRAAYQADLGLPYP